jgi:uncharacterized protein YecE (DUF72 family)
MKLIVGTSGYSYKFWGPVKGLNTGISMLNFYSTMTADAQFKEYCKHFDSVEICCTSYKKLTPKMCEKWYKMSPPNFTFTVKVSQYITNYKKLNDCEQLWEEFEEAIKPLKEKLGVVLFLFCEKFHKTEENITRLRNLKTAIPEHYKCAFEFRHSSWYTEISKTSETLTNIFTKNWVKAITHTSGNNFGNLEEGFHTSENHSNFVYIRLHGTMDYSVGSYGYNRLIQILEMFGSKEKPVYIYSNATDSWEPISKNFSLSDASKHKENEVYKTFSLFGKNMYPVNVQIIPSAVYDMKIMKMLSD